VKTLGDAMTLNQNRNHWIPNLLGETMPIISHGQGVWLYDTNGKKHLDGCSGATAANIGHTVVLEAIHQQSQKVSFVYRGHFTNEAAEILTSEIAARAEMQAMPIDEVQTLVFDLVPVSMLFQKDIAFAWPSFVTIKISFSGTPQRGKFTRSSEIPIASRTLNYRSNSKP
jgi:Aminotransferase class-III